MRSYKELQVRKAFRALLFKEFRVARAQQASKER
jgi:hypothetical protein